MSEKQKENWEEITLESILAEYKGAAFIDGQTKTPKETLDQMTQQILDETLGRRPKVAEEAVKTPELRAEPEPHPIISAPEPEVVSVPKEQTEPRFGLDGDGSSLEDGATIPFSAVVVPEPPAVPSEPEPERKLSPPPVPPVEPVREPEPESVSQEWEPGKVIQISFSGGEQFASGEPDAPIEESRRQRKAEDHRDIQPEETGFSDSDPKVSNYSAYANQDKMSDYADLYDEAEDDDGGARTGLFGRFASRLSRKDADDSEEESPKDKNSSRETDEDEPEGRYDEDAFAQDDMTLREAAGRYGKGINRYQTRGMLAILLSLVMLLFTALGQRGTDLPGIMGSAPGLTAAMLVMLFVVMFLTADVLAIGVMDIVRRRLGPESLVAVAILASIINAVVIIRTGDASRGLPYFPVVAFALGTALLGIKATRNAMKNTLRTAAKGASPAVMSSKFDREDGSFVLFRSKTDPDGFIRKTQQMDFSEFAYTMAAPLLLVMSAVFALLAALGGGEGEISHFVHNFAAMTAVSATFTGALVYGLPYSLLARKLMKAGAALAGWGGAVEADEAAGVIVTDTDVFPAGTLSLAGVRILHEPDTQRVISYTASLIVESRCGLADVFAEVVRKHKYTFYSVKDLSTYEGGGIEATINGEQVRVGSASFMNLMGIRLDQTLNVKNAVFTAIGGELAGVFAINYVPQAAVQEALESLLHTKIHPLFAVRDFNITLLMLQSKFNISTDKIDFLTYAERFALSGMAPDERGRPFAILNREGLGPLTDVVVSGKRLRRTVVLNTILSMSSSVVGLLLLLWFFWVGTPESASVSNVFFYLAAWLVVISLSSRAVTFD